MRDHFRVGREGVRCEQRKCAVPGGSYLQCEEKDVQCEERVYSIRRASSAVGGQDVWSEEKIRIIKKF